MKLKLTKPVKSYLVTAENGELLGRFAVDDEWEGMLRLRNENNSRSGALIVNKGSGLSAMVTELLTDDVEIEVTVVKASPSILGLPMQKEDGEGE